MNIYNFPDGSTVLTFTSSNAKEMPSHEIATHLEGQPSVETLADSKTQGTSIYNNSNLRPVSRARLTLERKCLPLWTVTFGGRPTVQRQSTGRASPLQVPPLSRVPKIGPHGEGEIF